MLVDALIWRLECVLYDRCSKDEDLVLEIEGGEEGGIVVSLCSTYLFIHESIQAPHTCSLSRIHVPLQHTPRGRKPRRGLGESKSDEGKLASR